MKQAIFGALMALNPAVLVQRDPSLAAALGALPGSDFGFERSKRADFGVDAYGVGGFGFGVDAPAPPPPPAALAAAPAHLAHSPAAHPAHPAHAQWLQHYNAYMGRHMSPPFWDGRYGYYGHGIPQGPHSMDPSVWAAEMSATARRAAILDPNEHSRLKIERYSFSMSPDANFVLGTPVSFEATLQPNTRIRAQRVVMNSPVPNFVLVDSLQVANVNVLVGTTEDAYTYNANGQGVVLDLPTLDPANRATVAGSYTGLLPPGYAAEFSYQFIVTFQGPSTIVGGL